MFRKSFDFYFWTDSANLSHNPRKIMQSYVKQSSTRNYSCVIYWKSENSQKLFLVHKLMPLLPKFNTKVIIPISSRSWQFVHWLCYQIMVFSNKPGQSNYILMLNTGNFVVHTHFHQKLLNIQLWKLFPGKMPEIQIIQLSVDSNNERSQKQTAIRVWNR